MSLLRTIGLYGLLIFLLWGCAVDKRPDQYTSAMTVSSSLSAHASHFSQYSELQKALKYRNLSVTDAGQILPINQSVCNAALFYRITQTTLPQYIGKHQDLLSGFYIDVARVNQSWLVVDTDNDFSTIGNQQNLTKVAASLMAKMMRQDVIIIRPAPGLDSDSLIDLAQTAKTLFLGHRLQFIVDKQHFALMNNLVVEPLSTTASQSYGFIAATEQTSDARKRMIMTMDSFDVADATAIVVDAQPLIACMQANKHAILSPTQKVTAAPLKVDTVLLASILPTDADFNRLAEQQQLLSEGKYLSINNQQLSYRVGNKPLSNRCSLLKKGDEDYQYCIDRQQDGDTVITTQKYIMKKQK